MGAAESQKEAAARAALGLVESGMRLGLGTGSTAAAFVRALGEKVRDGLDIVGVPTSEATRTLAESVGIRLSTLEDTPELDLTVDGADETDRELRLIKGGGGALLREKIVAAASKRMVVIADQSKLVETLGRFPLPVEAPSFGHAATRNAIAAALEGAGLSGPIILRTKDGEAFRTDNGNVIYDCHLSTIEAPERLAQRLDAIPGVMAHGLFIGLCSRALIAHPDRLETLERKKASFSGGRNVAMKIPPDEYEATLGFYRDTLKLPVEALSEDSHIVTFGGCRVWLDRETRASQAELWLEVETASAAEAAGLLARAGVVRCDAIEQLPEGFRGFWIKNPAGIVHLVCEPSEDG